MNKTLVNIILFVLFASRINADTLSNILSPTKQDIFKYQNQQNSLETNKLKKSWINPLRLQYSKSYSEQFGDETLSTGSYSVVINQPIFKSGGIFWSIKYANTVKGVNSTDIEIQRREMIGKAIEILFGIKQIKFKEQKQRLLIENDEIDIKLKADSYEAGVLDSSFLDQAILKRNADETALLVLQIEREKLLNSFSLLSDKNPNSFVVPKLSLFSKERYTKDNLSLKSQRLRTEEKSLLSKMVWAKYLPEVSVQGQYTDGDLNPLFQNPSLKESYITYGLSVSMPININSIDDIESSKVAFLEASVQEIDTKNSVNLEYDLIVKTLRILDKKIELDKKDEKLYKRLYIITKNLADVGEKTKFDVKTMQNSLSIKRLDQKIHKIDKQVQLLNMYIKVNSEI
jgi:outer membrane protein TolC